MKILCSLSGIIFSADHFTGTILDAKEAHHPIFSMSQKRLLAYAGKWAGGELSEPESFLLFLALLKSTDLVVFQDPIQYSSIISATVANNMELLLQTIPRLNEIPQEDASIPSFCFSCTSGTNALENVSNWIKLWNEAYNDFLDGYVSITTAHRINNRGAAIDRLLRTRSSNPARLANAIAEWAALAGSFPTFLTTLPNGSVMPIDEYWKGILIKCLKEEAIFHVPSEDLTELQDHCLDNIQAGSTYSYQLHSLLSQGIDRKKNYLGFGTLELPAQSYHLLDTNGSVEDMNKKILIDTAPTKCPEAKSYPSRIAYLKAKMAFDMATRYRAGSEQEAQAPIQAPIQTEESINIEEL